jgi:succinylarginine dihydrolase
MNHYELNIDRLVGPTHNYSGLSYGNEASIENKGIISNPRKACLQGLAKMKFIRDLGIKQAVLPPDERPYLPLLRTLGFTGTLESILDEARRRMPWIFPHITSSASMWAANSATITPSIDSISKKVQFTPANLVSTLHRFLESETTGRLLKSTFSNPIFFDHFLPLPSQVVFSDEGAANHTRFSKYAGSPGVHLFAYGQNLLVNNEKRPQKYPARQSLQASQAVAREHKIFEKQVIFAQQNPDAIDAGVFHNDVISTGHQNLFLVHEEAFVNQAALISELKKKVEAYCDTSLNVITVPKNRVSLNDAVATFLFNSQIITLPDGAFNMIAPSNCLENENVHSFLQDLVQNPDNPISEIHYINLQESMQNGGGPACLRLRVPLNQAEFDAMNKSVLLTDDLYASLVNWTKTYYRDSLTFKDLSDPLLYKEAAVALDELRKILPL